jgi:uncharacterized membrane protein
MSESKPPDSVAAVVPVSLPATPQEGQLKNLAALIQEASPEALKAIPVGERAKLAKVTIEQARFSYRSGMLPEPAELAAYDAIIPQGADRIMKMAEAQSAHRMVIERTVVGSQQRMESLGQLFGLIIALFFGACGTYAALHGQPWFGGAITGTTVVSLVGIFVYSKQQSRKELAEKRTQQMEPQKPSKPSGSPKKK